MVAGRGAPATPQATADPALAQSVGGLDGVWTSLTGVWNDQGRPWHMPGAAQNQRKSLGSKDIMRASTYYARALGASPQ